jgi:hypothetical protein
MTWCCAWNTEHAHPPITRVSLPGTATLLAHLLRHDAEAGAVLGDIPVTAVGVATPAVLTKDLAEGCSGYITSLVLMVRG